MPDDRLALPMAQTVVNPVSPVHPPEPLAARYARMAHDGLEPRTVDGVLRVLDVLIALVALVVCSLPMAAIVISLRLDSPRASALYRGRRVGRAGQIFTMVKFRTLRPDAEARLGPFMGTELDRLTEDEMTRLGSFLRVSKLDELPQLWNVLRGDMSIVGPRPIRPIFFEQLSQEIPQYWQRLVVAPGLTGFAQMRIRRDMSWAEKLAHDFEYIADRSVGLYLLVVAETVALILTGPFRRLWVRLRGGG
ncbi:MAG: Lipid carrier : UDP-N-acetylgalactosaminyltransferase [uncultured Solirubrobacterales bacterium]|uniref:Lipid carrier: UDP-N-acetylgalactosaminyltransferase n=1 Tax=uncultured Solirubrobacterales bacterium TaxID=768556 RepID=A0A6J4SQI5_9ACTN|nr:MAG: Lipid carrier : UDP-N-acetylgalactosaminyltransferase [uncultured Solirubrobacterales bacterium]